MLVQNSCIIVPSLLKYQWKFCYQCTQLFSSRAQELIKPLQTEGPWQIYSDRVSSGVLSKDPHQENVVNHLQQVYNEVISFERPVSIKQNTSLFSFFRKPQPTRIIAPKGLYIYGSVGGGKTMLMDLFYDTVPVNICFLIININNIFY